MGGYLARGRTGAIRFEAWQKPPLRFAEFVKSAANVSWLELCEREYFIRDRLLRGPRDDADPDGEMLRGWWAAVQCLFLRYAREMARPGAPSRRPARGRSEIFPPELAAKIAGLAGYLAVGTIPSADQRSCYRRAALRSGLRSSNISVGPLPIGMPVDRKESSTKVR